MTDSASFRCQEGECACALFDLAALKTFLEPLTRDHQNTQDALCAISRAVQNAKRPVAAPTPAVESLIEGMAVSAGRFLKALTPFHADDGRQTLVAAQAEYLMATAFSLST